MRVEGVDVESLAVDGVKIIGTNYHEAMYSLDTVRRLRDEAYDRRYNSYGIPWYTGFFSFIDRLQGLSNLITSVGIVQGVFNAIKPAGPMEHYDYYYNIERTLMNGKFTHAKIRYTENHMEYRQNGATVRQWVPSGKLPKLSAVRSSTGGWIIMD